MPFITLLQQATAALEAAPPHSTEVQSAAQQLATRLDDLTASFAPLKPLPKPSLIAFVSHVWPSWCRVAEVVRTAAVESVVLTSLCRLAQEALRSIRSEFTPWLPQTAGVLTAAFSVAPQPELLELADALLENLAGDDPQTDDAFVVSRDPLLVLTGHAVAEMWHAAAARGVMVLCT